MELLSHQGAPVALDICFCCQGIWFDKGENLMLSPGSVITLFEQMHAHRNDRHLAQKKHMQCPRCDSSLQAGYNQVRNSRYMQQRCPQGHGHFISFSAFMVEKGFVRQLTPSEVQELATQLKIIHCTSCGAAVDIRKDTACPYCGSAFSLLDAHAVDKALKGYLQAQHRLDNPPDLASVALIAATLESQRGHAAHSSQAARAGQTAFDDRAGSAGGDLLEVGLELFGEWLDS